MHPLLPSVNFCWTLIFCFLKISASTDTLSSNQSMSGLQTLVSSGKVFELGFFSPSDSSKQYLGIWYKNILPQTVVWVANRENPITDSSGTLSLTKDGNLELVNSSGNLLWSSNSPSSAKNPIAQILDSGNLVLRDQDIYLWQSFDYPTDTLLPGMKQGWDLKRNLSRNLTCWKSSYDPSAGNYSYSVDLLGLPQVVLRMGSKKLYRSGLWYDNRFTGSPVLVANSVFIPKFVSTSEEVYYTFEAGGPHILSRLLIGPTGLVQHYMWVAIQSQWVVLFTIQEDHCDTYNICGPFGTCDITDSPNCKCMKGFSPKSAQDWEVYITFGGCVRNSPLDCGKREDFVKYVGMKLPETSNIWFNTTMGTQDCREQCLKNCSCTGYSELDNGGNGKGCVMWLGDLVDTRVATGYGHDLYVRLSASELESIATSRKRRRRMKLILGFSIVSAMILLGSTFWFIIQKKIIKKTTCEEGAGKIPQEEIGFPVINLPTLAAATNNFSYTNKIGEGGFGPVFKGILPTGQEIAVKKLSKNSGQGFKELKNEVSLISKLQHRNLVRLLGCCMQEEEMMLIYEYMSNGSLDAFIFDKTKSRRLEWKLRYEIIVGIARGILYLHRDSRLRIIHRDIKASNILLDSDMNPKVSDFGLARTFGKDQAEAKTKLVVGTYGYMSPEYAVDGHFSVKSDVFSFGVLVLEIISGRKNRGFYHPEHDLNLLGHAWKLWDAGKGLELLDPSLGDQFSQVEAVRCLHVGLLCVQKRPDDRPTMSNVLIMLDGENAILLDPKEPGFFTERSLNDTNYSPQRRELGASNEVTISLSEGR